MTADLAARCLSPPLHPPSPPSGYCSQAAASRCATSCRRSWCRGSRSWCPPWCPSSRTRCAAGWQPPPLLLLQLLLLLYRAQSYRPPPPCAFSSRSAGSCSKRCSAHMCPGLLPSAVSLQPNRTTLTLTRTTPTPSKHRQVHHLTVLGISAACVGGGMDWQAQAQVYNSLGEEDGCRVSKQAPGGVNCGARLLVKRVQKAGAVSVRRTGAG